MMKPFVTVVLCVLFSLASFANDTKETELHLNFYGELIRFHIQPTIAFLPKVCAKDKCLSEYFTEMDSRGAYHQLLEQFKQIKKEKNLNDWMYFCLIRQVVEKMYEPVETERREILHTMVTSFYLSKSGYETRVTNALLKALFLYVHSTEKIYDIPYTIMDGKRYYNLTAKYQQLNTRGIAFRVNKFVPRAEGKSFSFLMNELPNWSPKTVEKTFSFPVDDTIYTLELELDSSSLKMMRNYPALNPMDYLNVPLSSTTSASLLPQLRQIIDGKSQREAVEVLISFTRRAFEYKWDWNVYDQDKPMIADELFFNEYSDHEDRCALFYNLVKELLDLPMIVVSHFNNDLTIGVALDEPVGDAYPYQVRLYTICDPTSPNNSKRLGDLPYGFKEEYIEIVGTYEASAMSSTSALISSDTH